ncbi:hypothetical protein IF2G_06255 [Cordyceps javanica]|nr:hypothetical protein IF2G_06255 [Cordyceps javanica]
MLTTSTRVCVSGRAGRGGSGGGGLPWTSAGSAACPSHDDLLTGVQQLTVESSTHPVRKASPTP